MSNKCAHCSKAVYPADPQVFLNDFVFLSVCDLYLNMFYILQVSLDGFKYHKVCAKCEDCGCQITLANFTKCESTLLCKTHYFKRFHEEGSYLGGDKFENKSERDQKALSTPRSETSASSVTTTVIGIAGTTSEQGVRPQSVFRAQKATISSNPTSSTSTNSNKCAACEKSVYPADPQVSLDGSKYHKVCAKCEDCGCQITLGNFTKCESTLLCKTHYFKRFHEEGSYLGGDKFQNKSERDQKALSRDDIIVASSTDVPSMTPLSLSISPKTTNSTSTSTSTTSSSSSSSLPPSPRITMKAVQYSAFSSDFSTATIQPADVTITIPAGQVQVKVHVASVNPIDCKVFQGDLKNAGWKSNFPVTMGYDFAGTVEAVADDVTGFQAGDRVFAVNWGKGNHNTDGHRSCGAFAEYITVSAPILSYIPKGVSFQQAAAVALVGTTAYQALKDLGVSPGTDPGKVLILGGATGVGHVAIQLAKLYGWWVAATCSPRSMEFASQWGADLLVDYTSTPWEHNGALQGVDVVFDVSGEANGFAKSKTVLKEDGSFISISNFDAGFDPKAHAPLKHASFFCLAHDAAVQDDLARLISSGQLRIAIEEEFSFTEDGVLKLLSKQQAGKSHGTINISSFISSTQYYEYPTDTNPSLCLQIGKNVLRIF